MVDPRSNVNESKQAYWQVQMRHWQDSGQSIRAFCAASNLSEASFSWWRRTLRKRGLLPDTSSSSGRGRRGGRREANRLGSETSFVPVQIRNDIPPVHTDVVDTDRIEVLLGTGHRLWVGSSVTKESLATVVSVLVGQSC
jgi:hypothetical protein